MQNWMMKGKRLLVLVLALSILALGAIRPPQARASTSTTLAIAGAALAAWVVILVGATYYIYGRAPEANAFLPPEGEDAEGDPRSGIRFGSECARLSGNPASFCW